MYSSGPLYVIYSLLSWLTAAYAVLHHLRAQLPSFLTPIPLDEFTSLYRYVCRIYRANLRNNSPRSVLAMCGGIVFLYRPPADCCAEFEVERIELPARTTGYHPIRVDAGCILLLQSAGEDHSAAATEVKLTAVREGEQSETTLHLAVGAVVYTSAGQDVTISTGASGAVFYRAHVNLGGR